jgi:hypothetical protein
MPEDAPVTNTFLPANLSAIDSSILYRLLRLAENAANPLKT